MNKKKTILSFFLITTTAMMCLQIYAQNNPTDEDSEIPISERVYLDEYDETLNNRWDYSHTYYYKDHKRVRNEYLQCDDMYYYFKDDGTVYHGQAYIDGVPYYFDDLTGAGLNNVFHLEDGEEYYYRNGKRVAYQYDNDYLGEEVLGYDGHTYWLDATKQGRKAVNQFVYIPYTNYQGDNQGRFVYYDGSGQRINGWFDFDGKTYYANEVTGNLVHGWTIFHDGLRYFDPVDFTLVKGVHKIGGYTYCFDDKTGVQRRGNVHTVFEGKEKDLLFDPLSGVLVGRQENVNGANITYSYDTGEWLNTSVNPLTYYTQGGGSWGRLVFGNYEEMAKTGCGPTSGAMLLSHFGVNLNPGQMARKMNEWGDYNANYGRGSSSTKWTHVTDTYGLKSWKCNSADDVKEALKNGAIIAASVRMGRETHARLFAGLDRNGMTTCYDPIYGIFRTSATAQWNNRSRAWLDCLDKGPFVAFTKE